MLYNIIKYEVGFINGLQNSIKYNNIIIIIKYTKYITRKWNVLYFIFVTLYFNWLLSIKLGLGIFISRTSNYYIKNYYKAERPYNRFPEVIKYYKKKKKLSYSFPSQSIQNITVLYYIYQPNMYIIQLLYWFIFMTISITRIFRGLHYPHDILFSYLYAYFISILINW